jgi:predicted nucleic acid-binding protein
MDTVGFSYARLGRLPITYHDMRDAVPEMVETAVRLQRRSAYDAAYLVLSRRLDAPLFTLDGALYRSARELGFAIELVD